MPIMKGRFGSGYFEVNHKVKFLKAVQVQNDWLQTYYVDYDSGIDTNDGKSTATAFKNLAQAITASAHNDVIYIKPRPPEASGLYYGGDPGDITPATAANWIIPSTHYGLQLVGCGNHKSQTCLQGYSSVTASPVLDIRAPYCNIENLAVKPGGSTTGLVKQSFLNDTAYQAWANTYFKLWFRNVDAQAAYSLLMDSGTYDEVLGCIFSGHPTGIYLGASNDVPRGVVIRDCDFDVLIASVKCDIYTSGAVARLLMTGLNFNHALPNGGSPNKYVSVASASTGLISDSYFAVADATIANSLTLNGIGNAHLWSASAEIT